jgi:AcrR family transcriptional regulator
MVTKPARKSVAAGNRKPAVLGAAAKLFAKHGFDGTSMRQVADLTKVQVASLYYHFPSKAEILVAVYQESARQMIERVEAAIVGETDPWKRLELACCAHVSALLSGFDFIHVVFGESPRRHKPEIRSRLIEERDAYEAVFRKLIDALPIRRQANRKYMMLTLLGAMAWSRVWYLPGGDSPETIAHSILQIVRDGVLPVAVPVKTRHRVAG